MIAALVMLAWMVNEEHFDRPSQEFEALEALVENLPGVDSVEKERWVEAPTFSDPTSWMSVRVDEAGLPRLIAAVCASDYPDAVLWSIRVQTPAGAELSLHAAPAASGSEGRAAACPDFGFDAVGLVDELDRVAPGLAIQPAIWEDDRFALVGIEEEGPTGFTHLLPLVEHTDDLLLAAGRDASEVVEINTANLGVVIHPGERADYLAVLTELAEEHSVSSYWADSGTPIDGIEKVQIAAPNEQHAAIEKIIRSSRLHIAGLPVHFIEQ
ncbi:hypothetical protein [Microbacterium sp. SS28]|uniref:hypothetical protein n=1 Tax=Microbacterium sp. SS28 TaxID=2919948 RepID=UPI001FAA36F3|nr:hypothetical protein [Microbacterium sp. SS28]